VRFAFCNEGFGERPWPAVCSAIAQAGYDGVEIAPFTLGETVQDISPGGRAELRQAARDAGIEIVGLHWLLVKPEGLHISHPDVSVRERTRDYLRRLADFCADVGGSIMVFGSPRQRSIPPGATPDDTWARAVETFTGVLPTLSERSVTLCFEPLTPAETDFINTAADARRLIQQIDHPNFRLLLDTKAMTAERQAAPDLIREHADLLAHVHANDANGQAPGFGDTDFQPILAALRDIGYDAYVSVEPFEFPHEIDAIARRSLTYLRGCLST
jgi:sugar phosphate isomerase/epimerase